MVAQTTAVCDAGAVVTVEGIVRHQLPPRCDDGVGNRHIASHLPVQFDAKFIHVKLAAERDGGKRGGAGSGSTEAIACKDVLHGRVSWRLLVPTVAARRFVVRIPGPDGVADERTGGAPVKSTQPSMTTFTDLPAISRVSA